MFLPLFCVLVLLSGCNNEQVNQGTPGFLTQKIGKNQILVGDKIYVITSETKIQDLKGRPVKKSDLDQGMKIQAFFEGTMEDKLLAKKKVRLLLVLTDEESLKEAEMVSAVLEELQDNKNQNFIITNVALEDDGMAYTMDVMKRSNLDLGYKVTVDAETYEILFMEG